MENWIFAGSEVLIKMFLSVIAIFIVVITVTRIAGLRTFAKMSSFDFASTIALGTIISSVIMNGGQSILKGGLAMISIVAFQFLFSLATRKSSMLDSLLSNKPLLLMKDGKFLEDNMSSANIAKSDCIAKLREANVLQLTEVRAMILESTGDISVLHAQDDTELQDILLEDVRS